MARQLVQCTLPERQDVPRSRQVDSFSTYLQQRWDEGAVTAGSYGRNCVSKGSQEVWTWYGSGYVAAMASSPVARANGRPQQRRASATQWLWLLLNEPVRHQHLLADLYRQIPELAANAQAAREFFRIVRQRDITAWPRWLEQTRHTALACFALSVQRDETAVMAALRLPWSNGPVEGHVHRLKNAQAPDVWSCPLRPAALARPLRPLSHTAQVSAQSGQFFTKCAQEPGTRRKPRVPQTHSLDGEEE